MYYDDLVEKRSKGSFTQEGLDDILAVVIGRPEHPGYIRGVGRGVGLKQFFGGPTRKVTLAQLSESGKKVLRNEFKKEMFSELRDELLGEIKSEIASLGLAIQVPPITEVLVFHKPKRKLGLHKHLHQLHSRCILVKFRNSW
ncbi:hypothetical protein V8G54_006256 [Vigna mungo]|uniref:Uncharacterized protein n=1 Tax=Vigna mungo TaxID=3915 RepID=A0AAQ3S7W8_VIGMU